MSHSFCTIFFRPLECALRGPRLAPKDGGVKVGEQELPIEFPGQTNKGENTMRKVLAAVLMTGMVLAATIAMADELVTVKYNGVLTSGTAQIYVNGASPLPNNYIYVAPMSLTVAGQKVVGFCVDLYHYIATTTYTALAQPAPRTENWCRMADIMEDFQGKVWTSADNTLGAYLQLAIWKLTYPDKTVTTSNATYNAGAQNLINNADPTCHLTCSADAQLSLDVAANMYGQLVVTAALVEQGLPVAGQEIELYADGILFGGGLTGVDGRLTDVYEVGGGAIPGAFSAQTEGRWITRLIPQGTVSQTLQSLAYGEPCSLDATGTFEPTPMGDPLTIGFWKHQFNVATGAKGKAQVPADVLLSYLPLSVFDVTVTSLQQGYDLLWLKKATMKQRAIQQCFATMLNMADGQLAWFTELDLDADGVGDGWFWEFYLAANDAYMAGDYETAHTLCDTINNL